MTKRDTQKEADAFLKDERPLIKEIEVLGFSHNEGVIYVTLLKYGKELGASKIALLTKIHRQYVYVSLDKLLISGLVMKVENGKRSISENETAY